jgi:shikimate dehydrogenase
VTARIQQSETPIRLGLIGANIGASQAPRLHETAGRLAGLDVSYDRLVPAQLGLTFAETFEHARRNGYRGVNITYPFKEEAFARVTIPDERVRRLGAINTVVFDDGRAFGFNTDHSGFIAAYRAAFGERPPGAVAVIGAGGVGKAIAFGLADLGVGRIVIADTDRSRADALASQLASRFPALPVVVADDAVRAVEAVDGVVNATPVGMVGHDGTPLPRSAMRGARWAFDAIYTPRQTQFLSDAVAEGLAVLPGYELFFHQGIDAFELFTGQRPDVEALRAALADAA